MTGSTRRSDRNDARWPPSVGRIESDVVILCVGKNRDRCGRWSAICPDAWFEWITGPFCSRPVLCPRCEPLFSLPRVEVTVERE